mmetsp:Transcript_63721/g.141908  ORF Transcript_63721/g.141908 Transcript_63721/m.141908 type:complete len:379 (-) Transcript_63721:89-1225(-)
MTLRRQQQLSQRPAGKAKAKAKAKAGSKAAATAKPSKVPAALTGRKCLTILEKLKKMVTLPKEARTLAREATKAARSRKRAEQEKSGGLLGRVLAKVSKSLEAEVAQARQEVDQAEEQQKILEAEQSEAQIQLKTAQEEVANCRTKLKESNKLITTESKALASCAAEKKAAIAEVKMADKECMQLEAVQEKMSQPLKQAEVRGPAARKQIHALCKAGQKVGFHQELLSVAPAVLKKDLERRRTFDQLVVKSLDSEFAKQAKALRSKLEENQQNLEDQDRTLEAKKMAVANAKDAVKQTARRIEEATEAVETGRKSVAAAKKRIKGLPSVLKKANRNFQRVQGRFEKFRGGPLGAYLKHQPVLEVDDHMPVDDTFEEDD